MCPASSCIYEKRLSLLRSLWVGSGAARAAPVPDASDGARLRLRLGVELLVHRRNGRPVRLHENGVGGVVGERVAEARMHLADFGGRQEETNHIQLVGSRKSLLHGAFLLKNSPQGRIAVRAHGQPAYYAVPFLEIKPCSRTRRSHGTQQTVPP